ncbi:GNAT family N-acetyltransferase [Schleiferilactobacillus shenzhenensis]|nr:GNAT family N-acetyltransferase [Schleiferilactobacillus shenzhenensis]
MAIEITTSLNSPVYDDALAIREEVFVQEQHVPADREVDSDEGKAIYFVAYDADHHAEGTVRLVPDAHGVGDVQRMAVRKNARHHGIGADLLQAIADYAQDNAYDKLVLHAQVHAIPFYQKLGYTLTSRPEFLDAGIRHREMVRSLVEDTEEGALRHVQ